jgi:predicted anti-sigma-YlaC factor YlaD
MNCQGARKFLYAFADGQLDVNDNCEVLDHLKMCQSCSSVVAEHQSMRTVLSKFIDRVPVPANLESTVRTRLNLRLDSKSASAGTIRPLSWIRVGAIAACLMLAAGAGSWIWWSLDDDLDLQLAQYASYAPSVVRVSGGTSAASNVSAVHHKCTDLGATHQNSALPSKLDGLGKALASHLGDRIKALAPDLSAFGFHFESVGLCGIKDGGEFKGGHLIYASADGTQHLSFMSIPRLASLDPNGQPSMGSEAPVYYGIAQDIGDDMIIAAWHRDTTTYVCCAQIEPLKIEKIVNSVRTDLVAFNNHMILAGIWPMK